MASYIGLANTIANDRPVALGTLFLASVYEGLNRNVSRIENNCVSFASASGPLWFVDLWFRMYFPTATLRMRGIDTRSPGRPLGGYLIDKVKKRVDQPEIEEMVRRILSHPRDTYHVYSGLQDIHSPPMWPDMTKPCPYKAKKRNIFFFSWDSILKPRYLLCGRKNINKQSRAHPEIYSPHLVARQLGCIQGIPLSIRGGLVPEMNEGYMRALDIEAYVDSCHK